VNIASEKSLGMQLPLDRGIAPSQDDFKTGRSNGPFKTHQEFLASLHSETQKLQSKKSKSLVSILLPSRDREGAVSSSLKCPFV